jgi:trehalose 6-phosphate synthase
VPGIVVVSNRGPLSFKLDPAGRPVSAGTGGGLAATLHPLLAGTGSTWVAAAMSEADRRASAQGLMAEPGLRIVTVTPEPDVYQMAYDVVSNATLWFCHHHLYDLPRRPQFDRHWYRAWDAYRELNEQFAAAVAAEAPEGDTVLVQDYHLSLLGRMLAERRPDLATVHFHHTPFADPSMLRVLPETAAGELLAGLAGFGACGFHTRRWAAAFEAAYADPALAGEVGGRSAPPTFVAPLGPDPAAIRAEATTDAVARAAQVLEEQVGGCRLIVRVDRIELSKNILRGLWALDELLELRPEWRRRVVMLTLAYPSREGLAEYLAYRSEIEHTVDVVNERWATDDWRPVLFDVADDRDRSIAALAAYDVLLVNPVRDGMNLVAKEGPLVNTADGVLVLSREAGAWDELGDAAIGVNPFDVTDTAAALHRALALDPEERTSRAARVRQLVEGRPASRWLADQLAAAPGTQAGPTSS